MFSDEMMGHLLSNAYAVSRMRGDAPIPKQDISEKEALSIFNEIVEVMKSHNISYQCACRISIALNEAFLTGAVELYNQDH